MTYIGIIVQSTVCRMYFRSPPQYFHCFYLIIGFKANLLVLNSLFFTFLGLQVTFQTKPCHLQAPYPGFRALSATSTTLAFTAQHQGRHWVKLATLTTPCRLTGGKKHGQLAGVVEWIWSGSLLVG